jgi:hypothetical protein
LNIFSCHDQYGETCPIEHLSESLYCGHARGGNGFGSRGYHLTVDNAKKRK